MYSPHTRHPGPEQVRPLVDAGPHQHAAVGAALDGQSVTARVLVLHQPLPGLLEVGQTVLQVVQSPGIGPGLSILSTTPDIGHSHDAKMLKSKLFSIETR